MYNFFEGKHVNDLALPWIYEHLMLTKTSMSLEEIRNMDFFDFQNHIIMIVAHENVSSGARNKKPPKKASDILSNRGGKRMINHKFNPESGNFERT